MPNEVDCSISDVALKLGANVIFVYIYKIIFWLLEIGKKTQLFTYFAFCTYLIGVGWQDKWGSTHVWEASVSPKGSSEQKSKAIHV